MTMLSAFFHAAFYNPIYNALVALISFVPGPGLAPSFGDHLECSEDGTDTGSLIATEVEFAVGTGFGRNWRFFGVLQ